MTPMMEQYYRLKAEAKDAILLFRMGDFYEIFGEDAETVAPILELVLTSREKGAGERIPFCGVPHHSVRNYYLRLLKLGYRIAIADQTEDPATAKGLVRRDIVRILTPGCIDELEGLEHDSANYLCVVYEEPKTRSLSIAMGDVSTGELRVGVVGTIEEFTSVYMHYRPREICCRAFFKKDLEAAVKAVDPHSKVVFGQVSEAVLQNATQQTDLVRQAFDLEATKRLAQEPAVLAVTASFFAYLDALKLSNAAFLSVRPLFDSNRMVLRETAVRDLELFATAHRRESKGSLFYEINQTMTAMGARTLRHLLAAPLKVREDIEARHSIVEELLVAGREAMSNFRASLKGMPDLARLAGRIAAGTALPRELALTRRALQQSMALLVAMRELGNAGFIKHLACLSTAAADAAASLDLLQNSLLDEPVSLAQGGGIFRDGFDDELDRHLDLTRTGSARVDEYERRLREETGIQSLKIRNHKSFGLLIEITKANLAKVPAQFIRRQTMVNNERFTTTELKELDDALMNASALAQAREQVLYEKLLQSLGTEISHLYRLAESVADMDVLLAFAWLANCRDFCRPRLGKDREVVISGGRHPVVESFVGKHAFVPNDVSFSDDRPTMLITGPNMAGKSTLMRQAAISAILSQIGCFVPARKATLPVFDQIFTRVGAADDLSRGQSTFMVEMMEASEILRYATPQSLIILDEVGRGTSTEDGLAIASAILKDAAERLKCVCLFATHFHELVLLAKELPQVRVMQTEVLEQDGTIRFSHRLMPGASGNSFGIEVAKLAGLPEHVILAANHFLAAKLTVAPQSNLPLEDCGLQSPEMPGLVSHWYDRIIERLTKADVCRMTPLQALNLINELQASLRQVEQPLLHFDEPLQ